MQQKACTTLSSRPIFQTLSPTRNIPNPKRETLNRFQEADPEPQYPKPETLNRYQEADPEKKTLTLNLSRPASTGTSDESSTGQVPATRKRRGQSSANTSENDEIEFLRIEV